MSASHSASRGRSSMLGCQRMTISLRAKVVTAIGDDLHQLRPRHALGRENADDRVGSLEASGIERRRIPLESRQHDVASDRSLPAPGAHGRFALENRQAEIERWRQRRRVGVRDEHRRHVRARARPTQTPAPPDSSRSTPGRRQARCASRIARERAYQARALATRHDTRKPWRRSTVRTIRSARRKELRDDPRSNVRQRPTTRRELRSACAPAHTRPTRATTPPDRRDAARWRVWRPSECAPFDCVGGAMRRKNARP